MTVALAHFLLILLLVAACSPSACYTFLIFFDFPHLFMSVFSFFVHFTLGNHSLYRKAAIYIPYPGNI